MDGTSDLFRPFMKALPKELRQQAAIYRTDYFLSYADLGKIARLYLTESGPLVLLAESFSTPLAIEIAAEAPRNLKGLVLCTGFAASPVRGLLKALGLLAAPVLARVATKSAIRSLLLGKEADSSVVESVYRAIKSVSKQVLSERIRAVLRCDVRPQLRQISVPILYLQAKDDRLVRSHCLEDVTRINPAIRSVEVNGPHLLLQREPQKTAEIVTQFLQELG